MPAIRYRSLTLGVTLVAATSVLYAQGSTAPPPAPWVADLDKPMTVEGSATSSLPFLNQVHPDPRGKVTAAQAKAWEKRLRAIESFLEATPILKSPRGFYPRPTGFVDWLGMGPYLDHPTTAPLVGGVTVFAFDPRVVTVDKGVPKLKPGADAPGLRVELNYIYLPGGEPWMHDSRGEFSRLPIDGYHEGFPIILDSLVVTRDGKLPFLPVSRERALTAFVAHHARARAETTTRIATARAAYEAALQPGAVAKRRATRDAELAAIRDAKTREVQRGKLEAWEKSDLEKLRKAANPDLDKDPGYTVLRALKDAEHQLATMTPAARARPAWLARPTHDFEAGFFVHLVEDGQGDALVEIDPQYFDPEKPRDTPRIAWIRNLQKHAQAGSWGANARALLVLFQQVDWRRFADTFLEAR